MKKICNGLKTRVNMEASRLFCQVSGDDLVRFSEEHEKLMKTLERRQFMICQFFVKYLSSIDESRDIELLSFGEIYTGC